VLAVREQGSARGRSRERARLDRVLQCAALCCTVSHCICRTVLRCTLHLLSESRVSEGALTVQSVLVCVAG